MPKSVLYDEHQVIKRATDLFWEKGYSATSMQDLVDTTGLNRSSLYNSFGDKLGLFVLCLRHYQENQEKFTNQLINKSKTAKESLISLFKGIQQDIQAHPDKGCFLSKCTTELGAKEGEVRNLLVDHKDKMVCSFQQLIAEAQKSGDIEPSKNAKHLALFLFSSLQGMRVTGIIDPENDSVIGITDHILESL